MHPSSQIALPIEPLVAVGARVGLPLRVDRSVLRQVSLQRQNDTLIQIYLQWSAVRVTTSGNPRDLNFSRTAAGITKWFWVTTEGYLSYLLPKFEDLIPTSLGDIAI